MPFCVCRLCDVYMFVLYIPPFSTEEDENSFRSLSRYLAGEKTVQDNIKQRYG